MFHTLDLFAGIGGFALGLERTGGFRVAAFCEVDPDPARTLKKNWPNVPVYGDVSGLTKEIMDADGITINVITGGFPCQDISFARTGSGQGLGLALAGSRSGLWFEYLRSEEHTSELQSLMRISYAVFCLQKNRTRRQPS